MEQQVAYLALATAAVTRRDHLSALQFGLRASTVPRGQDQIKCDAYLLLALTSLELDLPEQALAFAVGAHLAARWARDGERELRAEAVVGVVTARYPQMRAQSTNSRVH